MLLKFVLHGLGLAITATNVNAKAIPAPVDESAGGEIVRFKRDAILETRDIELAELHQVNLTQMYKHSVIKRDDGDHMTIWVDNSFQEIEGPEEDSSNDKRATNARLYPGVYYVPNGGSEYCYSHDRRDVTGPLAPTTGGHDAIIRWCETNRGHFMFGQDAGGWDWRNIIVGGSNGGVNTVYGAEFVDGRHPGSRKFVGVDDIRSDVSWTRSKRKQFNGQWKAASYGWETCDGDNPLVTGGRLHFEIKGTPDRV